MLYPSLVRKFALLSQVTNSSQVVVERKTGSKSKKYDLPLGQPCQALLNAFNANRKKHESVPITQSGYRGIAMENGLLLSPNLFSRDTSSKPDSASTPTSVLLRPEESPSK
jgi:hypothetical protein